MHPSLRRRSLPRSVPLPVSLLVCSFSRSVMTRSDSGMWQDPGGVTRFRWLDGIRDDLTRFVMMWLDWRWSDRIWSDVTEQQDRLWCGKIRDDMEGFNSMNGCFCSKNFSLDVEFYICYISTKNCGHLMASGYFYITLLKMAGFEWNFFLILPHNLG